MEILDLRHFASHDLRPVLAEEVDVWHKLLQWNYQASAEMILRYADSRILPGYAAIERGRVHGYCFFVYEGSKGVIGDLYVLDNGVTRGRRREIALELLNHAINTLQQSPGTSRVEAQLLVHPAGEMAEPFLRAGFHRYQRQFLYLPLDAAYHVPQRPLEPGIEMHRWTEADYQPAAHVITAAYANHVDSNVNDQYRSISGSLRFLNNIVRFPGCGVFDSSSSFVAIHRPSNTRAGLLLCSLVSHDVGHITQLCTLPEYRRSGIGEHLLRNCCADLVARRFHAVSLTVTEENQRALAFYKRLGFQTMHIFDGYVWEG